MVRAMRSRPVTAYTIPEFREAGKAVTSGHCPQPAALDAEGAAMAAGGVAERARAQLGQQRGPAGQNAQYPLAAGICASAGPYERC
jgi:hypothetical protein